MCRFKWFYFIFDNVIIIYTAMVTCENTSCYWTFLSINNFADSLESSRICWGCVKPLCNLKNPGYAPGVSEHSDRPWSNNLLKIFGIQISEKIITRQFKSSFFFIVLLLITYTNAYFSIRRSNPLVQSGRFPLDPRVNPSVQIYLLKTPSQTWLTSETRNVPIGCCRLSSDPNPPNPQSKAETSYINSNCENDSDKDDCNFFQSIGWSDDDDGETCLKPRPLFYSPVYLYW